jgi:L-2,4-diaminobutyrate decarboxylase
MTISFAELAAGWAALMEEHLVDMTSGQGVVLPANQPSQQLEVWSGAFPERGRLDWSPWLVQILANSNHLHHPGYVGHQVTAPHPLAVIAQASAALLNNSPAIFEMGPAALATEKRVVDWMVGQIGWGEQAGGFFCSGGSLGNLTALAAARANAFPDAWQTGFPRHQLCIVCSDQNHYSVTRTAGILGLGANSALVVPSGPDFTLDPAHLRSACLEATRNGRKMMAVIAVAPGTSTGRFDPLREIGTFCREQGIWFHVDAAHGGPTLLSPRFRHYLDGVELADSLVWDTHKMMRMPALSTAVLFRDRQQADLAFRQNAPYLAESDPDADWANPYPRTIECTRTMGAWPLYFCLQVLGIAPFREYLEACYDLTRAFHQLLLEHPCFEAMHEPHANIQCFRHIAPSSEGSDALQVRLRSAVLQRGDFYLVQTRLKNATCLRVTLINPNTTLEHLQTLLEQLHQAAMEDNGAKS